MRRADRLIRIVHFIRGRRRAVTAERIAEEFEISTRTVYRDIQDLMNTGTPISGEAGVGYIIDKQYYLPPVTFDAEELEAIGLGISMVRHWTDQRFAQKADSAFAKIQAVLPASLQGELEQITTYSIANQSTLPWSVSFSDLRESIRNRRKIRIHYIDESSRNSLRTLRPLALIFCSPIWLLAAWCEKRNDFRNFRLDRIQTMAFCKDCFADEKDKNLSAYKAQDSIC
ncbi:MAG TPA: YafY family transcriptional regulator [Rhodobacteraceae bacterium]|nr:YafY family transcriptional regulator [Paracoccaceae bacterium]